MCLNYYVDDIETEACIKKQDMMLFFVIFVITFIYILLHTNAL